MIDNDKSHAEPELLRKQKLREYWTRKLDGAFVMGELPPDRIAPAASSGRPERLGSVFPEALSRRLLAAARGSQHGLFVLLTAGVHALIHRYLGAPDFVTAFPASADRAAGVLALRAQVAPGTTFRELLEQTRADITEAQRYRTGAQAEIARALDAAGARTRFGALVALDAIHPGLPLTDQACISFGFRARDAIELDVQYDGDLYSTDQIARAVAYLQRLLEAGLAYPDLPVARLQLLSGDELARVAAWNTTETAYPRNATLAELFEQVVARHAEDVALVAGGRQLGYGALNRRANQVAGQLRDQGVQPRSVVGLLADRSFSMIAGILGILKAGCAYLPLDPTAPPARNVEMLNDAGVEVVVVDAQGTDALGVVAAIRGCARAVVVLRDETPPAGAVADRNPASGVTADDLAYVMYTSGSTGAPKGICISHRNVVRVVRDTNYLRIGPDDTLLQLSNYAFDGSTFDIFGALLNGARLALVARDQVADPLALARTIAAERVTVFFATTALFNALVDTRVDCLRGVRRVLFGGERVSVAHVEKALAELGAGRIVHVYGPTETAVFATYHEVAAIDRDLGTIPIGKPLSNTRVYVVDSQGALQPIGVPGEIWIGGDGVARGYLGRASLTAERFGASPFVAGDRIYRTGDLGRWLLDGSIEFLGRIDGQVKLRGFRIELGEIEARLLRCDGLHEAVVTEREAGSGAHQLCAYYTADRAIDPAALADALRAQLPDYMVPAAFVQLAELPLNRNGKIDKARLPAPELHGDASRSTAPPRDAVERTLHAIWRELLAVERIGIDDSFFALGGHSLKAAVLAARIHQELDVEIPLAEVFARETIAGIADYVRGADRRTFAAIPAAAPGAGTYPVSAAQRRLYVLSQIEGADIAYNVPLGLRLTGELDRQRWELALRTVVQRHESLRTSFALQDGQPVQQVHEAVDLPLEYSELGAGGVDAAVAAFVRPFDLGRAPLVRAAIVKCAEREHLFLLDVHHIACDGVSLELVVRELVAAYAGEPLAGEPLQYRDFVAWQDGNAGSPAWRADERYWVDKLSGELPVLALPTDRPRPAVQDFRGDRVRFQLPAEDRAALEALAQQTGTTLHMLLLAIYQVFLHRYTGQSDILVGTPAANRTHAAMSRLVGMVVNTVVMRSAPAPERPFLDFLAEVKRDCLDALSHTRCDFDAVVDKLSVRRDASRNPVFDAWFGYNDVGLRPTHRDGLDIEPFSLDLPAAKFDLTLFAYPDGTRLAFELEYATALFEAATARRMADHLQNLLAAIVACPRKPLGELAMMSPAEERRLLVEFNAAEREAPRVASLHGALEQRVAAARNQIALVHRTGSLTYGSFNGRANQLARWLVARGVGRGAAVAILAEPSPELVVGIYAVLKAGAAYVPINPGYPPARVADILADSGAKLVLTQKRFAAQLTFDGPVAELDDPFLYEGSVANLRNRTLPDDTAYVIYTSGSTGRPRGVMVSHASALAVLTDLQERYPLRAGDTYLFKTPFTFDVSVAELFGWFWDRGRLAILPAGDEKEPSAIAAAVERFGVTHLSFVPSMLHAVLGAWRAEDLARLRGLRHVMCAGEALGSATALRFQALLPGVALENLYGPTEATVYATATTITEASESKLVPIGKPLTGVRAYVLDDRRRLQPLGVPGELALGGRQVAKGYLNRDELTRERFVVDPFHPGQRMYLTGDIARWLPDGNLEYLGRRDDQVKIRGNRVEPKEVESWLLAHPRVREAVVVARDGGNGERTLAAYYVSDQEIPAAELRDHLAQQLPDYTIPSCFILLDAIPFNPNGKVDRRALPAARSAGAAAASTVAPRDRIEQVVADEWRAALGVDRFGIDDNFFALGGDSIKAIQIAARLRAADLELSIKDIFRRPTIRGLAAALRSAEVRTGAAAAPVEAAPDAAGLTPIQRWFFALPGTGTEHFNQSVMLHRSEPFRIDALRAALDAVWRRHDGLRLVFARAGGAVTQRASAVDGDPPALATFDLTASPDVGGAIAAEASKLQSSFCLERGPLFRAAVFHTATGDHLLLVAHHLVVDGVSWRILIEDLTTAYHQASAGRAIALPAPGDSYVAWAAALAGCARSEAVTSQAAYWRSVLDPEGGGIPKDGASERCFQDRQTASFSLAEDATRALLAAAPERPASKPHHVLVAALGLALKDCFGGDSFLVQMEGHGREDIPGVRNVERTVGWFTSMFPVRLDVGGELDAASRLARLAAQLRDLPMNGVGFGLVEPILGSTRRPDILFNYLGQFDQDLAPLGVTRSPWSPGPDIGPRVRWPFALDVTAVVLQGQLRIDLGYFLGEYRRETVERLAAAYHRRIAELVAASRPGAAIARAGAAVASPYPRVEPDPASLHEPFPLTDIQMAYLVGRSNLYEIGGTSTHVFTEIEGELDMPRFSRALQRVIARHPMLRAVILPDGTQRILEHVPPYEVEVVDLRDADPEAQQRRLAAERERMSHHVFQTDQWPLYEFKAFRLRGDTHALFMGRDLLVADGASMGIVGSELMALYRDPDAVLPPLEFSFRDYVIAYRRFKDSDLVRRDREFWATLVPDFPSAPALPLRQDPSRITSPRFQRVGKVLAPREWARLKQIARDHQVTPSALLATAYAEVLAYWSNQPRLALNLTIFNRYPFHEQVDRIVGDFTSTVVLGLQVAPGASFWDKAAAVQDVMLDALEHRNYEGSEVIRDLARHRNAPPTRALMPVVFTSALFGSRGDAGAGWEDLGDVKQGITQTSQVYIDHQVTEVKGELFDFWDYVADLFEPEVIEAMFGQYVKILERLLDGKDPGQLRLGEAEERWVAAYNATAQDLPAATLHGLFARQVAARGAHPAVELDGEVMSYAELDARASQVAHWLRAQGVKRGDYVAVLAHRRPATVSCLLGVLRAGAAYVPVDPEYPQDRQDYLVQHSGAKRVVGPEQLTAEALASYPAVFDAEDHPEDVAYVIYTSGSTGQPKGVVITHGAAANTVQDINARFGVTGDDRIVGLSSLCFDLSVYDVFGALAAGATLVQIPDQRDVPEVARVLIRDRITVWNSVPAIMDMLVDNVEPGFQSEALRVVMLSGDWIGLGLPGKVAQHFPHARCISLGGATEASIWSIYYPIEAVDPEWRSIPYGRPLANQTMYVLNHEGAPCPVGVAGEIYIGGIGVARGYLHDEEKTAAAFVEHVRYGRLYRTGDHGQWHRDGYIEFLGRRDQQVKIRGYRVELGEIEARLVEHPAVAQAVVADRVDARGVRSLCAYVVVQAEVSTDELAAHLATRLPDYMVPSQFMAIDHIPLSTNGKVDRKALPEPELPEAEAYEGPRNGWESALQRIWQEVLGVERVGIHDHFLELGGNSILMVQMRTRISRELQVDLDFRDFLVRNTVAKLAEKLAQGGGRREGAGVYPERAPDPEHRHEPFGLTDVQMAYLVGRGEQFEMGGVSTHGYAEIRTGLDLERLNRALQKVIDRHPMLRTVFLASGQQQLLETVPAYRIVVEDLRGVGEEAQQARILAERGRMSHHVFDPQCWPLFELKAFRLRDEESYLFVGYDLLIADGASFQLIFGRELMDYYHEPELALAPLEFTFRDYLLAYEDFKQSATYQADRAHWLAKAADFAPAPALPLREDPARLTAPRFQRIAKVLASAEWARLKQIARDHDITPSALLCAAYAEVLAYWSNQPRLALNLTVFNRYPFHRDVDKLIGDFTSVMLLDLERTPQASFWDQARRVQATLIDALEHRHYDGVELIRELGRRWGVAPGKALMPVVFTSMLFGNRDEASEERYAVGEVEMGISQTSQVYLDFQVLELFGSLSLTWDYVADLFEPEVIEAMFGQYVKILERLLGGEDPGQLRLGEAEERWVAAYNATAQDLPAATLHGLFARQVAARGAHPAVELDGEAMSYAELDARASQVAHWLRAQGVERGDYVAVLAHRRPATVSCLLGVLRAGAAYVPVDPEYPQDRQDYLVQHSGAKRVVGPEQLTAEALASYPTAFDAEDHPEDVAYVIYTSGSTGQPKGVVITHGAAANTVQDINARFGVTGDDRIVGLSSLCFDLSVYDVFGALAAGATLVQIPDQRDVPAVARVLVRDRITVWNSVPAIMDMLVDNVEPGFQSEALRVVMLSGDWIGLGLPGKVAQHFPHARCISLGGATEASIWSIYYPIEAVDPGWRSIPYGRPLANQTMYVLNHEGAPCPVGVAGEIYIGGIGVARGYLHDEEKTAAAFVEHVRYGRLYRTGDHGQWHRDGYIEFLGRRDQQVKIRGYRVELGEIEARLVEHPAVAQAVVADRVDARGVRSLCAYVVVQAEVSTDELAAHLATRLPDYMVPSQFMAIDHIPLSTNGKVDRKALPEPELPEAEAYEGPRNGWESALQRIWQEVLGVERVGIHDHFLELGGNSILMVQMRTRISRELQVDLDFRDFLVRNTVAKLAEKLAQGGGRRESAGVYPERAPAPEHRHEPFGLTDVQMAYLVGRGEQFEMGGVSTHGYAEIRTGLDLERLNRALQKVIDRHPMLRTVFLASGQQQLLETVPAYRIAVEDLRGVGEEAQQARILAERGRMSHHVFDPQCWPLFELKAFRLRDEESYLFVGYDLLIADGASFQLIFGRELMDFYHEPELALAPLEFTFRDYLLAYEDFKQSATYQADRAHWLAKAADFAPAPALPLREDPARLTAPRFQRIAKVLASAEWARLKQIARDHDITPSALLCAAYAEVLAYWSNQPRLALNLTVFNRYPFHRDVDKLIGDFTSVMLLDLERTPQASFWDQARRVQATLIDALEHRHYDGVELIRELGRRWGVAPGKALMPVVFTSMLFGNRDEASEERYAVGEVEMGISQTSQVYLDFQVLELFGSLSLTWDYVADLFEPEVIEAMFGQYVKILERLLGGEDPGQLRLGEAEERWVAAYNATAQDLPAATLHGLFARQVAARGAHPAVELDGEAMSYAELDARASQVAHWLRAQGVERGDYVAVLAHRRPATVSCLLGVLRAGAAYVPVDPEYPQDRQDYLVQHSGAKRVVGPEQLTAEALASYPTAFDAEDHPEDVAYVIYTSGSTGQPKGVVITHGAAANTVQDINARFGVTGDDRIVGLSSLCFDLSVYDVFGALAAGATLVQIPDQRDVPAVARVLVRDRITVWNSVPAIMDMLVDNVEPGFQSEALRVVMLSGDWIGLGLPGKVAQHFPHARCISLGGATEASIWSIYYPIEAVDPGWRSIPYGRPLANQTMYVLNHEGAPCPVGVAGEIYIGGIGVARGYLHDEEKTAAAFVEHVRYGRLYRTGDHGQWHRDGYIEFLGRRDQQVKIRGYRVELGEIEARLVEHPAVAQAVVADRVDARGVRSLCAYVVVQAEVSTDELAAHLATRLPDYMVPSQFMAIDHIPLSTNGKVDRKALPEPELPEAEAYEGPRNGWESALQRIWQEVLGVERVGIHDHFLELGGNSILMVQMRTRISRELQVDLDFRDFLVRNTVAKLAEKLAQGGGRRESAGVYPERAPAPEHRHEPFGLTDVQMAYLVGRGEQFEMGGVSTHGYAEIRTGLDLERLNRALQKVIDRHPMLRTVFLASGQQQLLETVPAYRIAVEDLRGVGEEAQQARILAERGRMSHHVFDPQCWPLFELKAFRLRDEESYLFVGYDLLIADGASFQLIFGRELMDFYHEPELALAPLEFTFRDYLLAYEDFKQSATYQADRAHWLAKAADFALAPALPLRQDPARVTRPRFARLAHRIDEKDWARLKRLGQDHEVTPSALLCAAYAEVLAYWSNQPRLALNLTVFNRYPFHRDVDKLIGDFTSVMLLDLERTPQASFWDQARRVQATLIDALEHRHYDGVELIRELGRRWGVAPGKALMPVVFTSMLFGNRDEASEERYAVGEVEMGISQTSQVYLDFQVLELFGSLSLTWDYVADLFEPEVIEAMFGQYVKILERLLGGEDPGQLRLGEAEERWVAAYNATAQDLPAATLHGLFARQVAARGAHPAVELDGEVMSYAELDARASQVAHWLRAQGVKRGDYVAVLAHRRPATVSALLGVLRAGAAYVPVDPEYPQDRQDYLVQHSGAKRVVGPEQLTAEALASYPTAFDAEDHPEDVAYVIYTSGSTGQPKGVVITHGAAANTVQDINARFGVTGDDRIVGLSSLCFDLSVYDVFGALAAGATLVQIPDQRDVLHIKTLLHERGITVWNSVPAIMDMLTEVLDAEEDAELPYWQAAHMPGAAVRRRQLANLKLVMLSGDWIGLGLPGKVARHFPGARCISLGGATEASIWSIYYPIEAVDPGWRSIPYGRPLANQTMYVLNHEGAPCPVGVAGEIYIGGIGVARGYLHDEEKTAAAFVEHVRYGRLYRTGDHGQWHRDGYIEFLGRRDQQVKIRGYRVELGEIEARLVEHPAVAQAVVADRADARGVRYLCAYVVAQAEVSTEDLAAHLSTRLPDYMVPSQFMAIDHIPLSTNGKVDRKALPDPREGAVADAPRVAPETPLEVELTEIWKTLLGVQEIGVTESLFDLGVNSSNIISFVSQVHVRLHRDLGLDFVFHHPTIRRIAKALDGSAPASGDPEYVALNEGRPRAIFCFPPIVAMGLVYQRLATALEPFTLYSFNFLAEDDRVKRYVDTIVRLQPTGPYVLLGYSAGGNVAFEVARALESRGHEVASLVLMDSFFIGSENPNRMSAEDCERYAQQTVDALLAAAPELQVDRRQFAATWAPRIERYYQYLDGLVNSGAVHADIHLIRSTRLPDKLGIRGDLERWVECTTGRFSRHQGAGEHEHMLDADHAPHNAAIIAGIFEAAATSRASRARLDLGRENPASGARLVQP